MRSLTASLLMIMLSLTACQKFSDIRPDATEVDSQADSAVETHHPPGNQPIQLVSETETAWPGSRRPVQVVPESETLPQLQTRIDFAFAEPVTLLRAARVLSEHTGVRIEIAPELAGISLNGVDWSGTAADGLDSLTSRTGAYWSVRNRRVRIFRTKLASWTLYAPSIIATWQASVRLSSPTSTTAENSVGESGDEVGMRLDTADFWSQLEASVTALVSGSGVVTLNSQTGELIVVDTPPVLERVDRWVRQKNRELATQVAIHVEMYEISRSADSVRGINFEGLFQEAVGDKAFGVDFGADDAGQLVGLRYSRGAESATDESQISLLLRRAAGNSRVSKITSTVLRTTNGQPVPVFFGDETSYLQSREIIEGDTTTSQRLVPGTLHDGIAINLVPRILPDTDRLALNITLRTSRIKQIVRFPADAAPDDPVIQLPDLESRTILLPVLLRSGETLFVAGLDTTRSTGSDTSAILAQENRHSTSRTSLVLLITPRIITPPPSLPARRVLDS